VISYESSRKSLTVAGEFASLLRLYVPPQTTLDSQQFAFRFGPHVAASPLHDGPETPTSPVTHPAPTSSVLASLVSATLRSPSGTLASYPSPFPSGAGPHAAALTAHNIVANRQRITSSVTIAPRRTPVPPKGQSQARTPTADRAYQSKSPVQALRGSKKCARRACPRQCSARKATDAWVSLYTMCRAAGSAFT
jgi:hypothetical protein